MANVKERLLKKLGTNITVYYKDGTTAVVRGLISRASTLFNSMLSLESHRKGDFLTSSNVTSGCIVENNISGEKSLVVALYPSVFRENYLSTIFHMVVVNSTIRVIREVEDADENGNIITNIETVVDQEAYTQVLNQDIKLFDPGYKEETQFLIYTRYIVLDILDKIQIITTNGEILKLKIISLDSASYKDILIIKAEYDTAEVREFVPVEEPGEEEPGEEEPGEEEPGEEPGEEEPGEEEPGEENGGGGDE